MVNQNLQQSEMLEMALKYLNLGFSIIPMDQNKKPLIRWTKYQSMRADEAQIRAWFKQFPSMNIGAVTGKISDLLVIDVEKEGSIEDYTPTITSLSGGGGHHFFYRYPNVDIKNSVKEFAPYTDIRAEGGCIVLPPSKHKSGNNYKWKIAPDKREIAELSADLLERLIKLKPQVAIEDSSEKKILKGERNNAAASYAGKIIKKLPPELWVTDGWQKLKEWNQSKVSPPLSETELGNVFKSITKKAKEDKDSPECDKRSVAEKLAALVTSDSEITLFHDQYREPFARVKIKDHFEILSCVGRRFEMYISDLYYRKFGEMVSVNTVANAMGAVEWKAITDGKMYMLHNRIARIDNTVWYDLGSSDFSVIKITEDGYEIVSEAPILFRRVNHLAPQMKPSIGGRVEDILSFVNIEDPKQKLLFMVHLVSFFIPGFAHPMPYVYGPQGSAKSTLSAITRELIDPSQLRVIGMPRSAEELILQISHHYFTFYDNLSYLDAERADYLCRFITGAGFTKRKLYTDDESVIVQIQANLGINGINIVATQPDLLERSVLYELSRIKNESRRSEYEILEHFKEVRPQILGAIFQAVSGALKLKSDIKLERMPRMADFALWGSAIAEALGYSRNEFLDAYEQNVKAQNSEALEGNIIAHYLMIHMKEKESWKGTPTDLHKVVQDLAFPQHAFDKGIPKATNIFMRHVNVLKPTLEVAGLLLNTNREEGGRFIVIQRIATGIGSIAQPSRNVDGNDKDDDLNDF